MIRPGFREVLADLAAGRAGALLCEDLDRLARQPKDMEDLLETVVEQTAASARSLSGSAHPDRWRHRLRAFQRGPHPGQRAAEKASADAARRVKAPPGQAWPRPGPTVAGPAPRSATARTRTRRSTTRRCWWSRPRPPRSAVPPTRSWPGRGGACGRSPATGARREVPTVTGRPWTPGTLRAALIKPSGGRGWTATGAGARTGRRSWTATCGRRWWAARVAPDPANRSATSPTSRVTCVRDATCGVCGQACKSRRGGDRLHLHRTGATCAGQAAAS